MVSKDNICIIIQGPSSNIARQRQCWNGYNYIFSTWTNDAKRNEYYDDNVIFSITPVHAGYKNINLQKISTLNGLHTAKNLGFTHCMKIRSDLYPTNTEKFMEILNHDKLNFISRHCYKVIDGLDGYLIDYMQYGPIDMMIRLWEIDNVNFSTVPEICLSNNYNQYFKENDSYFLLDHLNTNNDLWWDRTNIFISTYSQDKTFRTYW